MENSLVVLCLVFIMAKEFILNIMQWNSQSLRPKQVQFEALMSQEKIHMYRYLE